MRKLTAVFFIFSLVSRITMAQTWPADKIIVHINSNNPKIPFPQFLDYKFGKTLGREASEGVSDIEMEKTVREAYQIMMNRAVYMPTTVQGTKYIQFNMAGLGGSNGTGPAPNVSEGDGYALLAMAYMADKPAFDGLFMYVNDNKRSQVEYFSQCGKIRGTGYEYGKGTVGWKANTPPEGDPVKNNYDCSDCNSAADGDFDIALALLVAYYQWPTGGIKDACGNIRTYQKLATDYLKTISDTAFVINHPDAYATQPNWVCPPVQTWDVCPYGTLTPDAHAVPDANNAYLSGDIGWDGYPKSGNTFPDVTSYATSNLVNGLPTFTWQGQNWRMFTQIYGSKGPFIDYVAPSYFKAFADYLSKQDSAKNAWNIYQFRRVEASSDWLMGQLNAKGYYPTAGSFTVNNDGSATTFADVDMAEDARNPWRTILNYVWNGNPSYSWNPKTHQVDQNKPNVFEYNNAIHFGDLASGWSTTRCIKLGNDPTNLMFGGVATIGDDITASTGAMTSGIGKHINWNLGSGAAAIVAYHKDKNNATSKKLLDNWYRQLVLMWDATDENQPLPDSRYINSLPIYFHDWFRVLGLLVTTGNYQSPQFMAQPLKANLKIYNEADKSIAFAPTVVNNVVRTAGDVITYTFSYRNYASVGATNVQITYPFPDGFDFISASNGGALSNGNVVWTIGSLSGYTSTGETSADWKTFDPTKYATYGKVTLIVRVKKGQENKIICNQPTISADNSDSHTSNEYPNHDTPTMERNCVDIVVRSLSVAKKSDRVLAKKGDVVNFTISFENSSKAGWINGGRKGTRVTYANGFPGPNTIVNYFRFLHGASEPYINPGNYRISYYLNDAARIGVYDAVTNVNGWKMTNTITGEGGSMTFGSEAYTYGQDAYGQWNQRLIMRFPDTLMATTQHTNMFFAKTGEDNVIKYVHKGIASPFRTAVQMEAIGAPGSGCGSIPFKDLTTDDWSYTDQVDAGSDDKSLYFPISPSWFDYNSTYDTSLNVKITDVHPEACAPLVTTTFDRLMVEEFDGKVWRRVLGRGPVPGREVSDVYVTDTLPANLTFDSFSIQETLGVKATLSTVGTKQVIIWHISSLLPGAAGSISYSAVAQSDCAGNKIVKNTAWIRSSADSPIDSSVSITITCDDIPAQVVGGSTMYKRADKTTVNVGDQITYTVSFKQTDGTISNPPLTSTTNWTTACGESMFSFSNTGSESGKRLATYDYSHGTNGTLIAKVAPKNSAPFSLIFRQDRVTNGAPHCGTFKGLQLQITNNSCAQATISLFQNGTQVGATKTNIAYAAPWDTMTIKVQLQGDKLMFWINNFNALPYVFSGITLLNPGYVGFYNTSGTEPHKLISWYTNFDSGFQIDLFDSLTTQEQYVASSATPLYTQAGKYTNSITYAGTKLDWILVSNKTPMLFGDSVSFQFKVNVVDCGDGFVQNNTYANMMGQPKYKIGATKVNTCGTSPSCVPPTAVGVHDTLLTKGSTTTLVAKASPTNTNYIYTWYKLSGSTPVFVSSGKTASVTVSDTGRYIVRVADGDTTKSTCYMTLATPAKVTYSCVPPTSVTLGNASLIKGDSVLLTAVVTPATSGLIYNWYKLSGNGSMARLLLSRIDKSSLKVGDTGRYVVRVASLDTSKTSCYKVSGTARVTYGCVAPDTVTVKDTVLAAGGSTVLIAVVNPAISGATHNWYKLPNTTTPLQASGIDKSRLTVTDTGRYTVTVLVANSPSCSKASNTARVRFLCEKSVIQAYADGKLLSSPYQVKFCEDQTVKLTFAPQKYDFEYDLRGTQGVLLNSVSVKAGDSAKVVLNSANGSTSPYYLNVYADPGNQNHKYCWSSSDSLAVPLTVTVTPLPTAAIISPDLSYCTNEGGVTLTAQSVTGAIYQWYKGTLTKRGNDNVLSNADSGVYTVKVSVGNCSVISAPVTVVQKEQPHAEIDTVASKLAYCIGSAGSLAAKDAGSTASYTWRLNGVAQSNGNSTSATFSPASEGVWDVIVTQGGCADTSTSDSVKEVSAIQTAIQIGGDTVACVGSLVNVYIVDKTPGTVQWYQDGVPQPTADNTLSFTFSNETTIKAVLTTQESCATPKEAKDSLTVKLNTVAAGFKIQAQESLPICEGLPVHFTAHRLTGVISSRYQWYINTAIQPSTDSTFQSAGLKNGDVVRVMSTDACSPSVSITDSLPISLTPTEVPSVSLQPAASPVCAGQTVKFETAAVKGEGQNPLYIWIMNDLPVDTTTSGTFSTTLTSASTVYVELLSGSSCASTPSAISNILSLDVSTGVKPSVTIDMSRPSLCPSYRLARFFVTGLNGIGADSVFQWYKNGQPVTGATTSSYTSPFATGDQIWVVMTSNLACRTQDTAVSNTLVFSPQDPFKVSIAGNNGGIFSEGICKGNPQTFQASTAVDGGLFKWYVQGTEQPGQNEDVFASSTLNDGDKVKVTVSLPTCPSADMAQDETAVSVSTKPQQGFVSGASPIIFCQGKDTVLYPNENNANYAYSWLQDGTPISSGQNSPVISTSGTYSLVITNGACSDTSDATVATIGAAVRIDPQVTEFSPGDAVKLSATGGTDGSYSWTPSDLIPSTQSVITFFPVETMKVWVTVMTAQGCKASDTAWVKKVDKLFIPNAITPETGDQNAFWNIKGAEAYPELDVKVYNRWGSLVHEQKGYATSWDGTLNGKALPTGTYYYVLKDKKFDKPRVGDLTIVR